MSLFFFLKDGPVIRAWAERHLGVPRPVGDIVVSRTLQSLRGYFVGVTAVAAFNGIVIGLGALVLGVPQAGSIAVVNFAAAYIPFLVPGPQGRSPCSSRSVRREPTRPSP